MVGRNIQTQKLQYELDERYQALRLIPKGMSGKITLLCWVQGDKLKRVFPIHIELGDTLSDLKHAIQTQKKSFQHLEWDSLELHKFELPLTSLDEDSARLIKLEDGQELDPLLAKVSNFWKEQPEEGVLSVILPRPADTTIMPSSSKGSNLSQDPPPPWLIEIHEKLWGRRDLFDQVFRTANLTKDHFIKLQTKLHILHPSRNSETYIAVDVLDTKSHFLRSISVSEVHFAKSDSKVGSGGDLVPQLTTIDNDEELTPPTAADIVGADATNADAIDATAMDTDAMELGSESDPYSPSYIAADAASLSEGSSAILPCTIQYMDLTILELKRPSRIPKMVLIRDEWMTMVDIFNKKQKGVLGSAVYTGQSGIGITCLLYHILVLCLICAQPIVFQDIGGNIFIIDDKVRCEKGRVEVSGDDVLALVDADGESCIPNQYLLDATNLRVLLMSSPRSSDDRRWLTQTVGDSNAAFIMEPWSGEEFLITSLFLAARDITLERFQKTTHICGNIPRRSFQASESPETLLLAKITVIKAIHETENLAEAITQVFTDQPIHRAFEIYPSPESRSWVGCLARPVSDFALCQMVAELDRRGADAAYTFYQTMKGSRDRHASLFVCWYRPGFCNHHVFQNLLR